MKVNVVQAAKYLVDLADEDKVKDLTPLKIQKILYYVEGWYMGNDRGELFYEVPLAWQYGPVYRELYDRLRRKARALKKSDFDDVDPIDSKEILSDIRAVWKAYKDKSATELVALSHATKPWIVARQSLVGDTISKALMRDYFHRLAYES